MLTDKTAIHAADPDEEEGEEDEDKKPEDME
jgi:hypothetical protein